MLQTVRTPVGAFCSKEWSRIPYALDEHRFMQKWPKCGLRPTCHYCFPRVLESHPPARRGPTDPVTLGVVAVQAEWAASQPAIAYGIGTEQLRVTTLRGDTPNR